MKSVSTHRSRRRRRGFTLMEVLLVMAILVIMGTFVVANFSGIRKNANVNAAKTQLKLIADQLGLYENDMGSFPPTELGLQGLRQAPSDAVAQQRWSGPYSAKEIPADPWLGPYQYELTSDPASGNPGFKVWSNGPDQQSGTDDDVIYTSF